MNSRLVITKGAEGNLYEIQYVVHRSATAPSSATDVYACYRISNYDGMPIGSLVWIAENELVDADRKRVQGDSRQMKNPIVGKTAPGIGPGAWDVNALARQQEEHARRNETTVYRLYTEDIPGTLDIVARYFGAYTAYIAVGSYEGIAETARIIEVIGTRADLQTIVHLAGDIRERNKQSSVLITWHPVSRLEVTEP